MTENVAENVAENVVGPLTPFHSDGLIIPIHLQAAQMWEQMQERERLEEQREKERQQVYWEAQCASVLSQLERMKFFPCSIQIAEYFRSPSWRKKLVQYIAKQLQEGGYSILEENVNSLLISFQPKKI